MGEKYSSVIYKIFNDGIAIINKIIIGVNVQIISIICSFIKNRLVILLKIKNKNM